ncbi:MAG TPA: DUF2231 domain-containing protein [Kofleriaceae bacterium]|nr:DUF2231 domain-containing protein [Kofleriaceae bacterium]
MHSSRPGGDMYSKARVAGHPIHPMLVAFPIAFYTATVALLLAYIGTREAFWYRVAMVSNLAGIITAAIAVLPGAIDLFALPASSRARATGLKHAGFNLLATGLFVVTALLLYRGWTARVMVDGEYVFDATIPLAMSVVAWVSMVIAGSLGWTLVQTHHVGIKPALTRADRPSREPELDALEDRGGPEPIAAALHDTIDERGHLGTAPNRRIQPPTMPH